MKKAFVEKSHGISAEELALINKYSRRSLSGDDIYAFSLVLCDNEVDRDGERFSTSALHALKKLFTGKTGIFDHDAKAANQAARIFSAEVEADNNIPTKTGEVYHRLKARAYMLKSDKNAELIAEIDAGIKKEVSVGCLVGKKICSVCGRDLNKETCSHKKGQTYNGVFCCTVLDEPTDAYEWSFVAVPAQPAAGVIKAFCAGGVNDLNKLLSTLKSADADIVLTKDDARRLHGYMEELKQAGLDSGEYKTELQKDAVRLASGLLPEMDMKIFVSVCRKMELRELREFRDALRGRSNGAAQPLQLYAGAGENAKANYSEFKI